jgi:hypothetical protein
MALSLLVVCAEWHCLYSKYARNGTVFTRSSRRRALSLLGVCAEGHCLYSEYARNGTVFTRSMRGHRIFAEWHFYALHITLKKF